MPRPGRAAIVGVLGLTQILAWGSSYYLPAVLARPVAAATGWPPAWVVSGLSLGLLAAGSVSPWVGRTIERTGGRPVLALSAVLLALGLVGLALATDLAVWLVAWIVIGLGMGTGLYDAAFATLGRLYGQDARRAITDLTLLGGFASTVCWPLSAFLVETVGWRGTCLAYAGLQLALALPVHLLLLPRTPPPARPAAAPVESPTDGAPGAVLRSTRAERTAHLALLAAGLTLGTAIQSVVSVHLLTLLQVRGAELAVAVGLGALVGPSQVVARAVEKVLGSRFHPIWTMLASTSLVAGGLGLLWAGLGVPALCLVLYGAGVGIGSIARGTLPLVLFGSTGYATLMGTLALPIWVAGALAPPAGAFLLERIGASATLAGLATTALVNVALTAVLLLFVRKQATRAVFRPRSS
ncbi:MFS transporter [Benzoatithermus flavus]|uniref:MFS transporter n=1 Tax=Benzoatithermus flavus TaxID=3108223 RepID=A0ABU8XPS8_9PROT